MTTAEATIETRLQRLLAELPVFDGHNDLPMRLRHSHANDLEAGDISRLRPEFHTDIPRLRAGGVGGQFWSVFVPGTLTGSAAVVATLEQIDVVHRLVERYPDVFELSLTADAADAARSRSRIASVIGVEGGHQIGSSLAVLRLYHRLGARYLTLTHNQTNDVADAATDAPQHGGLSPFGREVVAELNRLGMLVDLSHVAPTTMSDALDVTDQPVMFSHSSVRELTDHVRNVPTPILERLRTNGGVLMITLVPAFVSQPAAERDAARAAELARLGIPAYPTDAERVEHADAYAEVAEWDAANPSPGATIADVADHLDFAREVVGIEHVGIGGDFDGFGTPPAGISGVGDYPKILAELVARGWSDDDLGHITWHNAWRLLHDAELHAAAAG